jgi:ferric-dicitrate binding protein FerR (iron transport regulator)
VYTHIPYSPVPTETSLFVPAGQRVSLTLSDGTVVWLNAQSRLIYPAVFMGEERRVRLEGEAYFEVAHNRDKPFIVATGKIDIKVLGTSFNVQNYERDNFSRVSLLEGSLQVYDPLAGSGGIILQPNEEVTIRDGQMNVEQMPDTDYFLWKDGIYSFNSEELGSILKKLELYYDVEIVVKNPSMLKWRYTVKFRHRDGIDEILRLLQRIHPFRMQKEEENNRIILDK